MNYEQMETLLINVSYEYNKAGVEYDELPLIVGRAEFYDILATVSRFGLKVDASNYRANFQLLNGIKVRLLKDESYL